MTDLAHGALQPNTTKREILDHFTNVMTYGFEPENGQLILPEVKPALVAFTTNEPGYAWLPGQCLIEYVADEDVLRFTKLGKLHGTCGALTVDRYFRQEACLEDNLLRIRKRATFITDGEVLHRTIPVESICYL